MSRNIFEPFYNKMSKVLSREMMILLAPDYLPSTPMHRSKHSHGFGRVSSTPKRHKPEPSTLVLEPVCNVSTFAAKQRTNKLRKKRKLRVRHG